MAERAGAAPLVQGRDRRSENQSVVRARFLLPLLAAGAAAATLAPAAQAALGPTIDVHVINKSGVPDDAVWLTLQNAAGTASSVDDTVHNGTPIKLSAIENGTFTLESNENGSGGIPGARLYVGFHGSAQDGTTTASTTRFDKVELGTVAYGVADLTSLDFFGIPFQLRTLDAAGQQLGIASEPYGNTMIDALRAIPGSSSAEVRNNGQFLRYIGPGLAPASYPSLDPYVASLAGSDLHVRTIYSGSPVSVLDYHGTLGNDGSITLTGDIYSATNPNGVPGQPLSIHAGDLTSAAIYGASGTYYVNNVLHSANDEYGALYRDFLAGFDLGLWGGIYGDHTDAWCNSPTQAAFTTNTNASYCAIYDKAAFAAARPSGESIVAYDQYAAVIHRISDSYGFPYSDLTDDHVQLPLDAPTKTLEVTILPDSAPTPPAPSGGSTTTTATPVVAPTPVPEAPTPAPTPVAPVTPAPKPRELTKKDLRDALSLRERARVGTDGTVRIGSLRCDERCGTFALTLADSDDGVRLSETWTAKPRINHRDLVELHLTKAARKRLRQEHQLDVRATVTLHTDEGVTLRIRETLTLLAPRRG
jgi:hypothetical protein